MTLVPLALPSVVKVCYHKCFGLTRLTLILSCLHFWDCPLWSNARVMRMMYACVYFSACAILAFPSNSFTFLMFLWEVALVIVPAPALTAALCDRAMTQTFIFETAKNVFRPSLVFKDAFFGLCCVDVIVRLALLINKHLFNVLTGPVGVLSRPQHCQCCLWHNQGARITLKASVTSFPTVNKLGWATYAWIIVRWWHAHLLCVINLPLISDYLEERVLWRGRGREFHKVI